MESLDSYLERLASNDAVPGGGSAAALTGALAAALMAMVGRIHAASDAELVSEADRLRNALQQARRRDEEAYAAVVAAQALPKRDDGERATRARTLENALSDAARAPLDACALALNVLELVDRILETKLGALASDVGCAAELAYASLAASAYNVRINHRYMRDASVVCEQSEKLAAYENAASRILERARRTLSA